MNPNNGYKFSVKKTVLEENGVIKEYATIVLENKKNGLYLPHPITDFIKTVYANGENYNTQKAPAEEIKKFMNWLLIEKYEQYRLKSFENLETIHAIDYLEYLKEEKKLQRNTIKIADRYITAFYDFLQKRNILSKDIKLNRYETVNGKSVIISPFIGEGVVLPPRKFKENKITCFPNNDLILTFLEVAEKHTPDIVLGVYFQIFGGLRRGEVVNLTRSSIKMKGDYGRDGVTLNIKDRKELFEHLSDSSKEQVKNERIQPIQMLSVFHNLMKNHLNRQVIDLNNNPQMALFVDRDGKPMSGAVYEKRFAKLKKAFLEQLEKNNSPHYYHLKNSNWNTHIGRGIYTNLMATIVTSPNELAILRGDRSIESSLSYLSVNKIKEEVQVSLENMFKGVKNYEN